MTKLTTDYLNTGVVIARFQTPELHEGHHQLIQRVIQRHKKVFIFLGISAVSTDKNPLDFPTRARMIYNAYPDVTVCPLADVESDELWAKNLDNSIRAIDPKNKIILYGSRDSFINYYKPYGKFQTIELFTELELSGTEVRESVSNEVRNSADFRAGQIYHIHNRYGLVIPTVDIIITRNNKSEILLGQKHAEVDTNKWRIIGGYIERKHDGGINAAIAEVSEEANLTIKKEDLNFIGQYNIDDWRYRGTKDSIMTTLFHAEIDERWEEHKLNFIPKAGDDLAKVKWFNIDKYIFDMVNPTHRRLIEEFIKQK